MRGITLVSACVMLVMPALVGCVGTAQASAMQQEDTAEDRAHEWDPAAELVGIVGVEGVNLGQMFGDYGADDDGSQFFDRASDDDRLGDGKCEVWIYRYVSPNKGGMAYIVVVDRDGEVLHADEDPRDSDDRPIGDYSIDSDEAASAAMDENEGLRQGTDKEHYGIVLVLHRESIQENPQWIIAGGGGDESGGGGGVVVIDAVTGEVLASHGGYGSAEGWRGSWGDGGQRAVA